MKSGYNLLAVVTRFRYSTRDVTWVVKVDSRPAGVMSPDWTDACRDCMHY